MSPTLMALTALLSTVEHGMGLYLKARAAAQQAGELTDVEAAALDARAEAIFASPAADPEANE